MIKVMRSTVFIDESRYGTFQQKELTQLMLDHTCSTI